MCFTNLPIELDEDGDPYLADEADRIETPGEPTDPDEDPDLETYGCLGDDPGVPISELDDEEPYAAVMETLPEDAQEEMARNGHETAAVDEDAADVDGDAADVDEDAANVDGDGTPERRTVAGGR